MQDGFGRVASAPGSRRKVGPGHAGCPSPARGDTETGAAGVRVRREPGRSGKGEVADELFLTGTSGGVSSPSGLQAVTQRNAGAWRQPEGRTFHQRPDRKATPQDGAGGAERAGADCSEGGDRETSGNVRRRFLLTYRIGLVAGPGRSRTGLHLPAEWAAPWGWGACGSPADPAGTAG